MSPVARTCVPPHSSTLKPGTDTTRTRSPYFSPNSAMAPAAMASSVDRTSVWTARVSHDLFVDDGFDLVDLIAGHRREVDEVEPQPLGRDERARLLDVRAQDLPEGGVQQVCRRVVAAGGVARRVHDLRRHDLPGPRGGPVPPRPGAAAAVPAAGSCARRAPRRRRRTAGRCPRPDRRPRRRTACVRARRSRTGRSSARRPRRRWCRTAPGSACPGPSWPRSRRSRRRPSPASAPAPASSSAPTLRPLNALPARALPAGPPSPGRSLRDRTRSAAGSPGPP